MTNDVSSGATDGDDKASNGGDKKLLDPIDRIKRIAQVMRRHSLYLAKHSAKHRERAWELDQELEEAFKALPEAPDSPAGSIERMIVLREGLKQLRLRATSLAEISTELTAQALRVQQESDAVQKEINALRRQAVRSVAKHDR